MEPAMKKIYLATFIGIVVTTAIASHLLAVGAIRRAEPGFLVCLRSGAGRLFDRLRDFLDDRIAAILARRERQAVIFALHRLTDRELKDIGLYRPSMVHDARTRAPERRAGVGDRALASPTVGERLR
jgi:uncharacterized protein YjiS (DUF1127 family)